MYVVIRREQNALVLRLVFFFMLSLPHPEHVIPLRLLDIVFARRKQGKLSHGHTPSTL